MVPSQIGSMVALAISRLTSAFRTQNNVVGITAGLLGQVGGVNGQPLVSLGWADQLEACIFQVINDRILANLQATVAANQPTSGCIDLIGGLVGEPRAGRVDAIYLPAVMTRIRINRSQGRAADVIAVANLIYPGAVYTEYPIMSFVVQAFNLADPNGFATDIGQTKAPGSRGYVFYSTPAWPPSQNLVPTSRSGAVVAATDLSSRSGGVSTPGLPVAVTLASPS